MRARDEKIAKVRAAQAANGIDAKLFTDEECLRIYSRVMRAAKAGRLVEPRPAANTHNSGYLKAEVKRLAKEPVVPTEIPVEVKP